MSESSLSRAHHTANAEHVERRGAEHRRPGTRSAGARWGERGAQDVAQPAMVEASTTAARRSRGRLTGGSLDQGGHDPGQRGGRCRCRAAEAWVTRRRATRPAPADAGHPAGTSPTAIERGSTASPYEPDAASNQALPARRSATARRTARPGERMCRRRRSSRSDTIAGARHPAVAPGLGRRARRPASLRVTGAASGASRASAAHRSPNARAGSPSATTRPARRRAPRPATVAATRSARSSAAASRPVRPSAAATAARRRDPSATAPSACSAPVHPPDPASNSSAPVHVERHFVDVDHIGGSSKCQPDPYRYSRRRGDPPSTERATTSVTKGCHSDAATPRSPSPSTSSSSASSTGRLQVLLVRRASEPFDGMWAIPGGFKRPDETLDEAAARELREETGVAAPRHLAQFGAYGDPGRDPRGNVVIGRLPRRDARGRGADGRHRRRRGPPVAGRRRVRGRARARLRPPPHPHRRRRARRRRDLEDSDLATAFVGPTFTLAELQSVYEAIWGDRLDAANFRRSLAVDADAPLRRTDRRTGRAGPKGGRRPELFRAGDAWRTGSPLKRPRRRRSAPGSDEQR